jgi:thymidine kinase
MPNIHFPTNGNRGVLELIYGSMFAGKSEELMRQIRRSSIRHRRASMVFKPALDNRGGVISHVRSHHGGEFPCIPLASGPMGIEQLTRAVLIEPQLKPKHIAIDEIQFLDPKVLEALDEFMRNGISISCSGLIATFTGQPWGFMPNLLAMADYHTQLFAICMSEECDNPATRTQRLVREPSGIVRPAYVDEPLISVGAGDTGEASDFYEAKCGEHFELLTRSGQIVKNVFSSVVS